ncbi:MAG: FtsX-like permease family protein [Clostridia bacterium]
MRKGFFMRLALTGIYKNRKLYYPYFLTSILTCAMLYMICSLSRATGIGDGTLGITLGLGVWVTTLFSVIFLFYTHSFLMKRRKREFGLYNILGMEKKHIARVVLWETLVILIVSLLGGFGLGMLFDKLLYMLLLRMLGAAVSVSFAISGYGIRYTLLVICGTFALTYLSSLAQIRFSKPIELLHGSQVGEREPKAKWIMALLGVVLLGTAYWLSVTVSNPLGVILTFFVAVVMVILGTYLLFTTGSIAVLKLLRKNKRYYYQPDHFINVSGMMYRMKQNAVGLANVCILCTMVLVIVFGTLSLWCGMEESLNVRYPRDVTITFDGLSRADQRDALAQTVADEMGLERTDVLRYDYLSFIASLSGNRYVTGEEELETLWGEGQLLVFALTLNDYNRICGEQRVLEDGEIYLLSEKKPYVGETLQVYGMEYRVKECLADSVESSLALASIYIPQFLVLKDRAAFDSLNERYALATPARYRQTPESYLSFNISGTDDDQLAYKKTLKERMVQAERETRSAMSCFFDCRVEMRATVLELYGSLFFVGLFLGALFIMAMILIIYYKQISEGYDDQERFHIMRKVGLSKSEIKRSISAQIMMVFFLPLMVAGMHVAFSFPSIMRMFMALGMFNTTLTAWCLLGSFGVFAVLYGVVYLLTARVYYKIVSYD